MLSIAKMCLQIAKVNLRLVRTMPQPESFAPSLQFYWNTFAHNLCTGLTFRSPDDLWLCYDVDLVIFRTSSRRGGNFLSTYSIKDFRICTQFEHIYSWSTLLKYTLICSRWNRQDTNHILADCHRISTHAIGQFEYLMVCYSVLHAIIFNLDRS